MRISRFLIVPLCGIALSIGTTALAADGTALYEANCAKCHGADGNADTPVAKAMKAPALTTDKWAGVDATAAIVSAVKAGDKHKAVAGKLSDEDLEAIAQHVRSLAGGS
jgi:mono/diheme cytochrome c family protein